MARLIYLVQGKSEEMRKFETLLAGRDFRLLTWDAPAEGAIFMPKSTWSEGRRALLAAAFSDDHDYFVFVDGDAEFEPAGLLRFEAIVARMMPAAAVPVFQKTRKYAYSNLRDWQLCYDSDEQFQAIHKSLIKNKFHGSPYSSAYDAVSWWYPCVLIQNILLKFFGRSFIQVNSFFVGNPGHGSYVNHFNPVDIDEVLRSLGCRNAFPLLANRRGKGLLRWKKWARADRVVSWLYALISPAIYVGVEAVADVSLPAQLEQHFREQNNGMLPSA